MSTSGPVKPLSKRERQLLDLAANGFTDSAIANRLEISEATVATYWSRIRMKFGPFSRPEIIAHAMRDQYEDEIEGLKKENALLAKELRQTTGQYKAGGDSGFFADVLEAAPDAVIVLDENGTIDWVNTTTVELFGFDRNELVGQTHDILVPARYRIAHRKHISDYFDSPEKRPMSEHMLSLASCKNGDEVPIAATLSPLTAEGQAYVVCLVRRLSREEALQKTNRP